MAELCRSRAVANDPAEKRNRNIVSNRFERAGWIEDHEPEVEQYSEVFHRGDCGLVLSDSNLFVQPPVINALFVAGL